MGKKHFPAEPTFIVLLSRMKTILLLVFSLKTICCPGQVRFYPFADTYTGLAACSPRFTDAFSFSANEAALSSIKHFTAGIYAERSFMMPELPVYKVAMDLPTTSGNFGLALNYAGQSLFNHTELKLAYGRSLGPQIDLGAGFNYSMIKIPAYGNASAISYNAGLIFHLSGEFHAGIELNNPAGALFGKEHKEKLPGKYSVAFAYEISSLVLISADVSKSEQQPVSVNGGIHYGFENNRLFARFGFSSATSLWFLGTGFLWKKMRIDVTGSVHPQLGITPGVLVIFNSKETK
jgi:hypothetical protein